MIYFIVPKLADTSLGLFRKAVKLIKKLIHSKLITAIQSILTKRSVLFGKSRRLVTGDLKKIAAPITPHKFPIATITSISKPILFFPLPFPNVAAHALMNHTQ